MYTRRRKGVPLKKTGYVCAFIYIYIKKRRKEIPTERPGVEKNVTDASDRAFFFPSIFCVCVVTFPAPLFRVLRFLLLSLAHSSVCFFTHFCRTDSCVLLCSFVCFDSATATTALPVFLGGLRNFVIFQPPPGKTLVLPYTFPWASLHHGNNCLFLLLLRALHSRTQLSADFNDPFEKHLDAFV